MILCNAALRLMTISSNPSTRKGNIMNNLYDDEQFFKAYANMPRSKEGLNAAVEWHQLQPLFPDLKGKTVLDLGCGYGL